MCVISLYHKPWKIDNWLLYVNKRGRPKQTTPSHYDYSSIIWRVVTGSRCSTSQREENGESHGWSRHQFSRVYGAHTTAVGKGWSRKSTSSHRLSTNCNALQSLHIGEGPTLGHPTRHSSTHTTRHSPGTLINNANSITCLIFLEDSVVNYLPYTKNIFRFHLLTYCISV